MRNVQNMYGKGVMGFRGGSTGGMAAVLLDIIEGLARMRGDWLELVVVVLYWI
jgi:hypothetical protein